MNGARCDLIVNAQKVKDASTVVPKLKWAMYSLLTIDAVHIWAGRFCYPDKRGGMISVTLTLLTVVRAPQREGMVVEHKTYPLQCYSQSASWTFTLDDTDITIEPIGGPTVWQLGPTFSYQNHNLSGSCAHQGQPWSLTLELVQSQTAISESSSGVIIVAHTLPCHERKVLYTPVPHTSSPCDVLRNSFKAQNNFFGGLDDTESTNEVYGIIDYRPSCFIEFKQHAMSGCPVNEITGIACSRESTPTQYRWLEDNRNPLLATTNCLDPNSLQSWSCFISTPRAPRLVLETAAPFPQTHSERMAAFQTFVAENLNDYERRWARDHTTSEEVHPGARNVGSGVYIDQNYRASSSVLWQNMCHRCYQTRAGACALPVFHLNYSDDSASFVTSSGVPFGRQHTVREHSESRVQTIESCDAFTKPLVFDVNSTAACMHCEPTATPDLFECPRISSAAPVPAPTAPLTTRLSLQLAKQPPAQVFRYNPVPAPPTPISYPHCRPDQCVHQLSPLICGTNHPCPPGYLSTERQGTCNHCTRCEGTTYGLNQIYACAVSRVANNHPLGSACTEPADNTHCHSIPDVLEYVWSSSNNTIRLSEPPDDSHVNPGVYAHHGIYQVVDVQITYLSQATCGPNQYFDRGATECKTQVQCDVYESRGSATSAAVCAPLPASQFVYDTLFTLVSYPHPSVHITRAAHTNTREQLGGGYSLIIVFRLGLPLVSPRR